MDTSTSADKISSSNSTLLANPPDSNPSVAQQSTSNAPNNGTTTNANSSTANPQPSTSRGTTGVSNGHSGSRRRKRILDGVVVAFSGYKNPYRAELRDMCLKLGAKYRQDWTDDCTHLM